MVATADSEPVSFYQITYPQKFGHNVKSAPLPLLFSSVTLARVELVFVLQYASKLAFFSPSLSKDLI